MAVERAIPVTSAASHPRPDYALVIYRSKDKHGVGSDGHLYGETGQTDAVQREADSRYWSVSPARRPTLRLLIVVAGGVVCRIWAVDADADWFEEPGGTGKVALPLADHPLNPDEVQALYPHLGIAVGDELPARRGPIRHYMPIAAAKG
ncbi:hypothetical protein [Streptomyces gibsoniae]|uniref:Uncharacterized protein n=1 Tax=Streptomyces gibsoniae TaxID=3075529 RepID=A0ABU2U995_9ACTN|nr:hypothetical protein [Streptomyces sp. DSM 41699]MDT0469753.1 hypothetical protein [Streptomyces sp. DSM 41699]